MRKILSAILLIVVWPVSSLAQQSCDRADFAVQVLGSGGPFLGSSRASSGYLVWRNGRAVVLIDAGGGTYLRYGETSARFDDLSLLAITHLHPDHVADLPAFLWVSDMFRQRPLAVAGPSGAGPFPDMATFVSRLFDGSSGAYQVLGGTLGQPGRGVPIDVRVVDVNAPAPIAVFADDDIEVTATSVPHANAPSLAYKIQAGERSVVFSSDQAGTDRSFVAFAMRADVLVMHLAVSPQAPEPLRQLHATPAIVGQVARDARVASLVLSHLSELPEGAPAASAFSVPALDANVAAVGEIYDGPVVVAEDLSCIIVE